MKGFDELYKAYYSDVFRFLNKLCGFDCGLAEELTRETFFHAYLGITKFRDESDVKTWLLQIAKNRYFLLLRKKKHRAEIPLDGLVSLTLGTDESGMFETAAEKQLISDSLDIVFSFQPKMRAVFLMRIYYDTPYSEIASRLGIGESSAKVLFHRAKQNLKNKLREEYGYEI